MTKESPLNMCIKQNIFVDLEAVADEGSEEEEEQDVEDEFMAGK